MSDEMLGRLEGCCAHLLAKPRQPCHACAVALIAVALWATALAASEPTEVAVVRDGKRLAIPNEVRDRLAQDIQTLFATCSINSRDHPQVFATVHLASIWRENEAKDHLTVRLATPFELNTPGAAAIPVEALLLGLSDSRFPGPELTRHGDELIAYGKCSGGDSIKFVCTPGVRDIMPGSYHALCRYLERDR